MTGIGATLGTTLKLSLVGAALGATAGATTSLLKEGGFGTTKQELRTSAAFMLGGAVAGATILGGARLGVGMVFGGIASPTAARNLAIVGAGVAGASAGAFMLGRTVFN